MFFAHSHTLRAVFHCIKYRKRYGSKIKKNPTTFCLVWKFARSSIGPILPPAVARWRNCVTPTLRDVKSSSLSHPYVLHSVHDPCVASLIPVLRIISNIVHTISVFALPFVGSSGSRLVFFSSSSFDLWCNNARITRCHVCDLYAHQNVALLVFRRCSALNGDTRRGASISIPTPRQTDGQRETDRHGPIGTRARSEQSAMCMWERSLRRIRRVLVFIIVFHFARKTTHTRAPGYVPWQWLRVSRFRVHWQTFCPICNIVELISHHGHP